MFNFKSRAPFNMLIRNKSRQNGTFFVHPFYSILQKFALYFPGGGDKVNLKVQGAPPIVPPMHCKYEMFYLIIILFIERNFKYLLFLSNAFIISSQI